MAVRLRMGGHSGVPQLAAPKRRAYGAERSASSARRGYGGAWRRAREGFLAKHPLCEVSALRRRTWVADTVDHLYPHCGLKVVFWDRRFWVAMSGIVHSGEKQRLERRGLVALDELADALDRPRLRDVLTAEAFGEWERAFESRRTGG